MPRPCCAETVGAVELVVDLLLKPQARMRRHELSTLWAWNGREYVPPKLSMIFMRPPQHGHGGASLPGATSWSRLSLPRSVGVEGTCSNLPHSMNLSGRWSAAT